jgi:hypothetical protein
MAAGWQLDVHESTRRALKYRRGDGEILTIDHEGAGGIRSAGQRATSSTWCSIWTLA